MNDKLNVSFELLEKTNIIDQKYSSKCYKAICKITSGEFTGTGFFCEILDPDNSSKNIIVLFTCHHVINPNKKEKVNKIYYKFINEENEDNEEDKGKEIILKDQGRRDWSNPEIDYYCIEMLEKDNIHYYLNIDKYMYEKNNYTKDNFSILIFISQQLSLDSIKKISEYNLFYKNTTKEGWSGSPVIRNDNYEVIGIHQGKNKDQKEKIGILLKYILKDMKKEPLEYEEEYNIR